MQTLYIGTDSTATLNGVVDQDGMPIAEATIKLSLSDGNGQVIDDQSAPFPILFEDEGGGIYKASVDAAEELSDGLYRVRFDVVTVDDFVTAYVDVLSLEYQRFD